MKYLHKLLIITFLSTVFLSSCVESQYDKDIKIIDDYISLHNLDTLQIDVDNNGVYRVIIENGTGLSPESSDSVTFTFTLRLTNDVVVNDINAVTPCTVSIGDIVPGLGIGICRMMTGEHSILLVPSYLGYGGYSVDKIPSNAVLVYDVNLISFKKML